MKVIVLNNYEEVSRKAFEILKEVLDFNPKAVLGLATGSSPIGLYEHLIKYHNEGFDFSNITSFNLDEYIGISKEHPQSYHYFMQENLFKHININANNIYLPDGLGDDLEANCKKYDELLNKYQIDVQILGIGSNGHIGFNEPGCDFKATTNIVKLKDKTREDNKRFFNSLEEVPTHAITMGIKSIMAAKKIILIATGENKAKAIKAMIENEVNNEVPATILSKHEDVVVIIDKKAASLINYNE